MLEIGNGKEKEDAKRFAEAFVLLRDEVEKCSRQMDDWEEICAWVAAMPRSVAQQAWVVIQMMLSAELDHMDLGDMEAAREVIDRVRGNHA